MRELKILAVVVALTLITYWGVEPFAHSQMHPHVAPADFKFSDVKEDVSENLEDTTILKSTSYFLGDKVFKTNALNNLPIQRNTRYLTTQSSKII